MVYKALDVANYIVNYCIDINNPISNLKLQKIMYYIQAAFLVDNNGEEAFNEPILAWRYGPVIEGVYRNFKSNLDRPIIKRITNKADISQMSFNGKGRIIIGTSEYNPDHIIGPSDKLLIEKVVNSLIDKDPFELVESTHQELPWKNTDLNCIISINDIKSYFIKNRGRIYGQWN